MSQQITEKLRKRVIRLGKNGETCAEIMEATGLPQSTVSQLVLGSKIGGSTVHDYQVAKLQERGYTSAWNYRNELRHRNSKRLENKAVAAFINIALEDYDKTKAWLAHEIQRHRDTVSIYATCRGLPPEPVLEKIFGALGVPHLSLDTIVEMYYLS